MLDDFKAFILRGNVIDLAIAVAIGAAFATVIQSFTDNILNPFLAIPGDVASVADLDFELAGSRFTYGRFFDAIADFVIIAAAIFFFVVRPVNVLMARHKTEPEVASTTRGCPYCLSSIPVAARRCAFCTADVSS